MTLSFDNLPFEALGMTVYRIETDDAPERAYEVIKVPGRNGSLLMDSGRYENVPYIVYGLIIGNVAPKLNAIKALLNSKIGYYRMEDSDHPDEYYMAVYKNKTEPTLDRSRDLCKVKIEFERKPQRYLKTGEMTQTYTASGYIQNPTAFDARPLVRAYGTGRFALNGRNVTISTADEYTDIDCELMDCYKGTVNCNANVTLSGHKFPVLAGLKNNRVFMTDNITQLEIIPRWWRL